MLHGETDFGLNSVGLESSCIEKAHGEHRSKSLVTETMGERIRYKLITDGIANTENDILE